MSFIGNAHLHLNMSDPIAFSGQHTGDSCGPHVRGEEFRGRRMVSDRYFTYVKTVADRVRATHPDKYVTCIAYSVVESPPKRVKLPANVGVVITQDVGQWHDPEYKQADMRFASAWARAAGAFGTYDYTGLTWLMPRVYPHAMAESLRFYDRLGAMAVTNEAFPTWWYAGPLMYLRAKLMWDPKLDPDVILDDFYSGFFGPARAEMKRFYDVLERCMMKKRQGRWFEGLSSVIQQLDLWDRADLAECREAMRGARARAAGREPFEARVAFVGRGFGFADALLEEYWQAQQVERAALSAATTPEQVLQELQGLLRLRAARESVWESIRDDQLVSGLYRVIFESFESRVATWRSYLASSMTTGVSALTAEPGGMPIEKIKAALPGLVDSGLADDLAGLVWAREHPEVENLCRNGGFEETKGKAAAPQGIDWVSTNTPPHWSKWALKPENHKRLTWESQGGRDGPRRLQIAGALDACFIQVLPANPGERYYVSAWANAVGSKKARVRLVVQWKDNDGAWVWSQPRREACYPRGSDGWRQLSLVFSVPEGVGRAVILLAAKDQQVEDFAWFDDVRLVRLPDDLGGE